MDPKTLSGWIDQLRGMIDDPAKDLQAGGDRHRNVHLDAIELQILRLAVSKTACAWKRGTALGCSSCTTHNAAHRTPQPPDRCQRTPQNCAPAARR